MKDTQNNNALLIGQIKNSVRETADQAPMNVFINDRIRLRRSLEGGWRGLYMKEEIRSEALDLRFISLVRLS